MELIKILWVLVGISSTLGNPQNYYYFQRTNHPTIFHQFGEPSEESPNPDHQHTVEAPTFRHQQTLEIPTLRHQQTVEIPTLRHQQVGEIPTLRHQQIGENPTFIHQHSAENPTLRHQQRVENPTFIHQHSAENPTLRHQQRVENPTFIHQHSVETPTLRHQQRVEGFTPQHTVETHDFDSSTEEETNNDQFQPSPIFRHRIHFAEKRKRRPNLFHQAVNSLFRFKNNPTQKNHFNKFHNQHSTEKLKPQFHRQHSNEKLSPQFHRPHSNEKMSPQFHHHHSVEKMSPHFHHQHSTEQRIPQFHDEDSDEDEEMIPQFHHEHQSEQMQSKSFNAYPTNPNPTPSQLFNFQKRPYVQPQIASIQLPDFTNLQPKPAPQHKPIQFHVTEINTSGPKQHGFSYTVDNNDNVKFTSSFNFGSSKPPPKSNYAGPTIPSPVSSPLPVYTLVPVSNPTRKTSELETKPTIDANLAHSADPENKFGSKITPKIYTNHINQNPIKIETFVHPEFYVIPNTVTAAPSTSVPLASLPAKVTEQNVNKKQKVLLSITLANPANKTTRDQPRTYFRIEPSPLSSAFNLTDKQPIKSITETKVSSPSPANTITLATKEPEKFDRQQQKIQAKSEQLKNREEKEALKLSNSEEKGLAHIEQFKKTVNLALEEIKEPGIIDTLQQINETKTEVLNKFASLSQAEEKQNLRSDQKHIEQFQKTVSLALEGLEENNTPTKNPDEQMNDVPLEQPEENVNPIPTAQVNTDTLVLDEVEESENLENPQPTSQAEGVEFRNSPPLSFLEIEELDNPEPTDFANLELLKTHAVPVLEEIEVSGFPEPTVNTEIETLKNNAPLSIIEVEGTGQVDDPQPTNEVKIEPLLFKPEDEPEILSNHLLFTNHTQDGKALEDRLNEEKTQERPPSEANAEPLKHTGSLTVEKAEDFQALNIQEPTYQSKNEDQLKTEQESQALHPHLPTNQSKPETTQILNQQEPTNQTKTEDSQSLDLQEPTFQTKNGDSQSLDLQKPTNQTKNEESQQVEQREPTNQSKAEEPQSLNRQEPIKHSNTEESQSLNSEEPTNQSKTEHSHVPYIVEPTNQSRIEDSQAVNLQEPTNQSRIEDSQAVNLQEPTNQSRIEDSQGVNLQEPTNQSRIEDSQTLNLQEPTNQSNIEDSQAVNHPEPTSQSKTENLQTLNQEPTNPPKTELQVLNGGELINESKVEDSVPLAIDTKEHLIPETFQVTTNSPYILNAEFDESKENEADNITNILGIKSYNSRLDQNNPEKSPFDLKQENIHDLVNEYEPTTPRNLDLSDGRIVTVPEKTFSQLLESNIPENLNEQVSDYPTVNEILKTNFPFANRLLLENGLSKSSLGISKYQSDPISFNKKLEKFSASATTTTERIRTTTISQSSTTPSSTTTTTTTTTTSVPITEKVNEFISPKTTIPPPAQLMENIPTTILPGGAFEDDKILNNNNTILEPKNLSEPIALDVQEGIINVSSDSESDSEPVMIPTTTTESPPTPPAVPIVKLSPPLPPLNNGESNEISRSYNNATRRIKVVIKRKLGRRRAHVYKL